MCLNIQWKVCFLPVTSGLLKIVCFVLCCSAESLECSFPLWFESLNTIYHLQADGLHVENFDLSNPCTYTTFVCPCNKCSVSLLPPVFHILILFICSNLHCRLLACCQQSFYLFSLSHIALILSCKVLIVIASLKLWLFSLYPEYGLGYLTY